MAYSYPYARPALAVDCVVFGLRSDGLSLLLIERGEPPFRGEWALPGGFVRVDESLDQAARRELSEEAGVTVAWLEQLYSFGAVDRDPRERVVSVAYFAIVSPPDHSPRAATDAKNVAWHGVDALPRLTFDHARIVAVALERLRMKMRYSPIGFELLPPTFTLTELQRAYEAILGRALDKRNFRKRIAALGFVVPTGEKAPAGQHRTPALYRFDRPKHDELMASGFDLVLV